VTAISAGAAIATEAIVREKTAESFMMERLSHFRKDLE
jgi:hypothetical protein